MQLTNLKIEELLAQVQKPARYVGNEWNATKKEHSAVAVTMALAFPDLYEVGMSNQGVKVLYEVVNSFPEFVLERVFAPAADMEELLRKENLPLFSLENRKPVSEFDIVGFSLQYELCYTTVLNMLDLAGIPLYSSDRSEDDPLIAGGGPCVCNPEPVAPFFDLFVLGDGEEVLPELLNMLAGLKSENISRREKLIRLSSLQGVYVPAFYKPHYGGHDGRLVSLARNENAPARPVSKRILKDLDTAAYPVAPIVPYIETVHDRGVVELFRGCTRGCRFCQASYIYRPVRRRSREKIIETAQKIVTATGYDEVSLASLSSSDYPRIDTLIDDLNKVFPGRQIKYTLPSLRLDSYSVKLAEQVHRGRRSSLTFAPEAATERLRGVIGKNLSEHEIFTALSEAIKAGWQGFKLYFMIGLPTEEDADVEQIIMITREIKKRFQRQAGRKLDLAVSVSTFVPKAHTPFQWEPQISMETINRRQQILRQGFKSIPGINFSWHDVGASILEAVFARGDRRLAPLLERAWQLGCRLDGWSEHFKFGLWQQALSDLKIDPQEYAQRRFEYDQLLPWDHLDYGAGKDSLIREHLCSLAPEPPEGAPDE